MCKRDGLPESRRRRTLVHRWDNDLSCSDVPMDEEVKVKVEIGTGRNPCVYTKNGRVGCFVPDVGFFRERPEETEPVVGVRTDSVRYPVGRVVDG